MGGGGFRPAMPAGGFNAGFRPGGFNAGFRPGGFNGAQGFTHSPSLTAPRENFNLGARPGINNFAGANNFNREINVNNFNRIGNNNLAVNRGNINNLRPWNNGFQPNGRWNNNRPYNGYHNNWVNGYWPGHYGGWGYGGLGYGGLGYGGWGYGGLGYGGWGYGGLGYGGYGMGLPILAGLGVGAFGAWGMNPYSYGWGYSSYANPFMGMGYSGLGMGNYGYAGGVIPTSYDYATPLDTVAATPAEEVVTPANSTFDQARDAFKSGNYPQALDLINQTIKATPNDADAHEFRAVILFAMGQYKDAATALYTVLASGPGWDWTTLISLYPNVEVYTQQLRSLEQYRTQNPNDPSSRFVLAYLYTTQGANAAADAEFQALHKLIPNDPLITRLDRTLTNPPDTSNPALADANAANPASVNPVAAAPANPDVDPTAASAAANIPPGATINGTWKATPNANTTITLTENDDNTFTWNVAANGQSKPITGKSQYQDGVLALTQENGPPLAGKVTWDGPNKFNFRLVGNGDEDPGLNFVKVQ
jgi:tetratricopeptide (TPR) repeat protein